MENRTGRLLVGSGCALVVVSLLSACSTPRHESDLSRVKLYSSVGQMAKDSAAVVTAKVTNQRVAADIDPDLKFTISTLTVEDVGESKSNLKVGSLIDVRQTGSEGESIPVPLMQIGSSYLLFLTPSGLDGDLAKQFYVTGANAGLYAAGGANVARSTSSPALAFRQVQRQDGENLPDALTLADAIK